jgi:hypothetical protein
MSEIPLNISEIEEHIAIVRENPLELMEQAAAYSGVADEELISQRIGGQGEDRIAHRWRRLARVRTHGARRGVASGNAGSNSAARKA